MKKIVIGITASESRYENYPAWIKGNDPSVEIVKLDTKNFDEVNKCDGIILSGGIDTHPKFYKNKRIDYPNAPNTFDEKRDETELKIFSLALQHKIPVLGICRGMQLVNIALGGDLIQDIEEAQKKDHRRHGEQDAIHEVKTEKESLLYAITRSETGIINSAHHQALGNVADALIVNAWSADGIAEGAEWKEKKGKPFLLCIQWHPERLAQKDPQNPFTKKIREEFLQAIKNN